MFGSVYAEGVFDEFLERGYHPLVQTHRGCPFTCIFCHASAPYYSKMLFQSPEVFRKDLEYLGKMFKNNPEKILYIANANMSLFKQDFEIAKIIKEVYEKYGFPEYINVNTGKNAKKLVEMIEFLPQIQSSLPLQTLTPKVLENIKRENITLETFTEFQKEVFQKAKKPSSTELIIGLPGETKETFIETIRNVINTGVQDVVIYTLMNLKGTPLSTEGYIDEYEYIVKHRVVPRQFSEIEGTKIFDTEEVLVANKDLSFEDYLELRGISFIVMCFYSTTELIPLKKFLQQSKVDIAQWIFNIHSKLSEESSNLNRVYQDFLKETEDELFDSKEELEEFYCKNYQDLLDGKRGDNLMRKYRCILLSDFYAYYLKLAISEAKKLFTTDVFKSLSTYLVFQNVKLVLLGTSSQKVYLDYDIPNWLEYNEPLIKGRYKYEIKYKPNFRERFESFLEIHGDRILSLQMMYRDGYIKDFFPEWRLLNE